jgi:hypothetical protein
MPEARTSVLVNDEIKLKGSEKFLVSPHGLYLKRRRMFKVRIAVRYHSATS